MANRAEAIVLFDAFFLLLMNLFGASFGLPSLSAFSTIRAPTLSNPPVTTCGSLDIVCIGASLAVSTAYIGWAIVQLVSVVIFIIQVIIVFFNGALAVAFNPSFGANGVPVVGTIFVFLQLFVIWQIFREFRGSAIFGF